ncbi:hypothetical protein Dsin_027762 [Dipteronia sinensis]|uniref:Uncharacterized protein n=1 Tax=Dipteronia sinensis TaxID=43782 RepID=A0AAE0DTW3_9ROSI|nr:hypothetical protein Dsin_027762 [Dipteronia sinensis]
MAYFSSNYYDSYAGESYQTPYSYGGNYDIVPSSQALMSHSDHEFSSQNLFEYNFNPYYGAYDPFSMNRSVVAYSASTYSEPKSFVSDFCNGGYNPEVVTQFRISYSVSESSNDIKFEEYDPTPYDGGYDQAQTYGKPLPHSEAICYPRSHSTLDSGTPTLNGFIDGSTESPYGKENVNESAPKPHIENEKTPAKEEQQQLIEYDANHDQDDKPPVSDHGCGYNEGCNYEYENLVQQNPFGYGSEGLDLCESIFGYWPCLDKYNQRGHECQQVGDYGENNSNNQWNETADYLFGRSSYPPYEERRAGDVIYSYQRHHQPQPLHMQKNQYLIP